MERRDSGVPVEEVNGDKSTRGILGSKWVEGLKDGDVACGVILGVRI